MDESIKRINTRQELQQLAKSLGVGHDWLEPDNQNVDVCIFGAGFDNAGFWGLRHLADRRYETLTRLERPPELNGDPVFQNPENLVEMFVVVYKDDKAIAEVNLATLFAFACGYEGRD